MAAVSQTKAKFANILLEYGAKIDATDKVFYACIVSNSSLTNDPRINLWLIISQLGIS